jgi:SAM-dependent methyltransferase
MPVFKSSGRNLYTVTQSGIDKYLSGRQLYGDDFDADLVQKWYQDEEDASVSLHAGNPQYEYEYAALNVRHGFRHLPTGKFETVMGFGSAYGDELSPISGRIGRLVIVESADSYRQKPALDVPTEWRKATITGDLDMADTSVDLVTCFCVLHHISNVSYIVSELGRVTKPGGYLLLREPVISMGDWSGPRAGLTPHERGIPRHILLRMLGEAGFDVERETWCVFSGGSIVIRMTKRPLYDKKWWVVLDQIASRLFAFNYRYHATSAWAKVRPTSSFVVARRR